MIDGFPYSFFFPLVIHALAGLTTAVTGVFAFSVPKGPTRIAISSSPSAELAWHPRD